VSEIAKRWLVAGIGVPVVVALLYVGGLALAAAVAVLAGLGACECYRLADRSEIAALDALGVGAAAAMVVLAAWYPRFSAFAPPALSLIGALALLSLVVALRVRGPSQRPHEAVAITVFGSLYGGLSLAFVPLLRAMPDVGGWARADMESWGGLTVVALPLAATWIGDAVALFAGRAWGNGGLAPTISPKKSWIGVWAGLTGAAAAGSAWWFVARSLLPGQPIGGPAVAAGVGVLLGIAAVLGDLAESLLKREAGVKDSGAVFPGHGGVLDRLDALTFTLPAAYLALAFLDAAR
jgi:phosphatidate cytidylyltransferase